MKKKDYLESVEDFAYAINGFARFFGFSGAVATGILAALTSILVPFIVVASVFALALVDNIIGKVIKFKAQDISSNIQTREGTTISADAEIITIPPIIYGILAVPSIFMKGNELDKKSIEENENVNLSSVNKEQDLVLEKSNQAVADKNSLKEIYNNQTKNSKNKTKKKESINDLKVVDDNNEQLEM